MFPKLSLLALSFLAIAYGQQAGTLTAENHPRISIQQCAAGNRCTTQDRKITLDSNWRWTHQVGSATNCYTGNSWNKSLCPDPATCSRNCAVDGADYSGTYGITTSGNSLNLRFVTNGPYSKNIGSRVYLMQDDNNYQLFKLKNQEFTFDVDMSNLPCGLNGALYFVSMDQDGGKARFPNNKAGAKFGTGYCDAQCAQDIKFINGEANVSNWAPSLTDPNGGTGKFGTCCTEMDVWEANSMATAFTPHSCTVSGQYRCENDCGSNSDRYNGVCDRDGCDFNSYRMGDKNFLGRGKTVDTTKKMTVVTQFITAGNSPSGALTEIRRIYVQDGRVIQNSSSKIPGVSGNSITDNFCAAQKSVFGDTNDFAKKGGLKNMGDAFDKGMVLVMSIWDDHFAKMLWLDSNYPTNVSPSKPGVARGACPTTSGDPKDVENNSPNANVAFSNIRYGPIGSTYKA